MILQKEKSQNYTAVYVVCAIYIYKRCNLTKPSNMGWSITTNALVGYLYPIYLLSKSEIQFFEYISLSVIFKKIERTVRKRHHRSHSWSSCISQERLIKIEISTHFCGCGLMIGLKYSLILKSISW